MLRFPFCPQSSSTGCSESSFLCGRDIFFPEFFGIVTVDDLFMTVSFSFSKTDHIQSTDVKHSAFQSTSSRLSVLNCSSAGGYQNHLTLVCRVLPQKVHIVFSSCRVCVTVGHIFISRKAYFSYNAVLFTRQTFSCMVNLKHTLVNGGKIRCVPPLVP